ncbi:MAG: CTP synthase [Candidatus Niyogibacteria bacterium]|nr:CTP synthase [Candidatus Niyogibacteria bacterium]
MPPKNTMRYIFVTGGVMSGVGKGIATASLGRILKDYGFSVTTVKIDPYINVDAGTMNPLEHGETFVTEDGLECDQDIGNYERFLDQDMYRLNYMTTGQVYQSVIEKERAMAYGGKCVEVVPHIPEEVVHRIETCAKKTRANFVLIEIGGTVGEYQNLIFLEAARMMKLARPENVAFIMVSFLPIPGMIGEMKTKPTQHAVRALNSAGIQPDIIIARAEKPLDQIRKHKLAVFCNVKENDIISAPDIKSIYEVPINFEKDKLGEQILAKFSLRKPKRSTGEWAQLVRKMRDAKKPLKIAIIGKYFTTGHFTLADSYISVIEAIKHAAWSLGYTPEISWLDAEKYEKSAAAVKELKNYAGVIVPGGFGSRGVEGKIRAIRFAREHKFPYLGLCYGMQIATIEAARNLLGLKGANTTEIDPATPHPVIHTMHDQESLLKEKKYGGSMRLGAYSCTLASGSLSRTAYGEGNIIERHRHRYEFNNEYRERLEKAGFRIAGVNTQRDLVEIVELAGHPFFVGVQFHPELKSRPTSPHPLFKAFIKAATKNL